MKEYCINCGYGNEYGAVKPKTCSKCNQSFANMVIERKTNNSHLVIKNKSEVNLEPSQGDEYYEPLGLEVEGFMEGAGDKINLAGANQSYNLRDVMKSAPQAIKPIKTSRRKKK